MARYFIGQRVRAARQRKRLFMTRKDLLAGLQTRGLYWPSAVLCKVENDLRPVNYHELMALSIVLNVNPEWLAGRLAQAK